MLFHEVREGGDEVNVGFVPMTVKDKGVDLAADLGKCISSIVEV